MGDHSVQRFIRVIGVGDLYDLDLIELVQTVQSTYILSVGSCLTTETRRIGRHLDREIGLVQDHIPIDIRHRNLSRRNQIEIIEIYVVHLPLLIGKLSGSEARRFVHHQRRHHLGISGSRIAVEEERNQRTLQRSTFALVDRETCTCQLHAQLEIDQVIFFSQLPVRQCPLRQIGHRTTRTHHHIVGRRQSMGYILVREIRQRHDQCIQVCLHLAEALLQPLRLLLQFGSFLLGSLGLLFFPLFKQLPHLFGNGILLSKTGIQLSLKRFTLVVQRFDPIDSLFGIDSLYRQTLQSKCLILSYLLNCQHDFYFYKILSFT